LILPFVGGSLAPLGLFVFLKLFFWARRVQSATSNPLLVGLLLVARIVCILCLLAWFMHNGLTVFYGNINNDAHSDSWIIDVVAPVSHWNEFRNIDPQFQLSHSVSRWNAALRGPHMECGYFDTLAQQQASCGPHIFARFMYHQISNKSRIAPLLTAGVMFGGVWVMVERPASSTPPAPKVFTDFAYGNDFMFNKMIIAPLRVDSSNHYNLLHRDFSGSGRYYIESGSIASYNNQTIAIDMQETGIVFDETPYLMDQYSCMNEARWLDQVTGKRWCFYKMMDAKQSLELRGTLSHPLLKKPVAFPTPPSSIASCDQPQIRAVLARGLQWTRDTYLC